MPALHETEVEKIARLPSQLAHLLAGIHADELDAAYLPGEWTVAQNIHHLADSHMNSYIRCKLILTEEEPALKPYDQERWADLPDSRMQDVALSIELLRGLHARWVCFWGSLQPQDWQRTGSHPQAGLVTLADQLRLYAAHGEAHIAQIRRTVGAKYPEFPATKEEMLARVDLEWARFTTLLSYLSTAEMETPIAEGWTPKAHVAHIAEWERVLIRHIIGGEPLHLALGLDPTLVDLNDVEQFNAAIEARTRSRPVDEVLEEAFQVHADARAALAAVHWPDWTGPLRENEPAGLPRQVRLAGDSYEHYLEHWQWLPVR